MSVKTELQEMLAEARAHADALPEASLHDISRVQAAVDSALGALSSIADADAAPAEAVAEVSEPAPETVAEPDVAVDEPEPADTPKRKRPAK